MQVRLEWGQVDPFGIVHYPTYFRWFDNATVEMFRTRKETDCKALFDENRLGWPIVECGGRFRSPAYFDDLLTITSSVAEIGTKSFRVEHVVTRDGEELGRGFEIRAFASSSQEGKIRALPLSEAIRGALGGTAG